MTWTTMDPKDELPPPNVYGVEKGAQLRVEVHTFDDGQDVIVQCLCAACFEVDEVGLEDSMGIDRLSDGIHYLEWWHEEYHFPEGTEHDTGLRYTEKAVGGGR